MKKTFGLIFFIAFALVGCGLETKTLSQFYEKNLDDVNKIVIVDGSTGNKKTVTENEVIKEFLSEIKDIKFILDENQEKREGWRYSIKLFQDDKPAFQFGLSEVNENYYYTEPDIYPIVENFYENLDVQEE
jgi:Cdc6-like AAA superfamily ATPase